VVIHAVDGRLIGGEEWACERREVQHLRWSLNQTRRTRTDPSAGTEVAFNATMVGQVVSENRGWSREGNLTLLFHDPTNEGDSSCRSDLVLEGFRLSAA